MASPSHKSTDNPIDQVCNLEYSVGTLGESLVKFSDSLRALYRIKPEDLSGRGGQELRELRDGTKSDALFYVNNVLPKCELLVQKISAFMDNYQDYTYKSWLHILKYIIKEAESYRQECEILKERHLEMSGIMKSKQDEALQLEDHLRRLTFENVGTKKQLLDEAGFSSNEVEPWKSYTFVGIPYIINNSRVKHLYEGAANRMQEQIDMDEKILALVVDSLIPALDAVTDGFDQVSGFFGILSMELSNFNSKGERAREQNEDNSDDSDNDVNHHFEAMKKHSARIKNGCAKFFFQVPSIKSNLRSITRRQKESNSHE